MKSNKLKTGEKYVYNFALKRGDGLVEQDMLYADKLLSLDELKNISEKHHCEIVCSLYGVCRPVKDNVTKENTFVVTLPKPVDIIDDKSVEKVEAVPMIEVNELENNKKENNIENC